MPDDYFNELLWVDLRNKLLTVKYDLKIALDFLGSKDISEVTEAEKKACSYIWRAIDKLEEII